MNEDAESLSAWGVPQDVLEYAAWPHPDFWLGQLPPIIVLPDRWTPGCEPQLERVVSALALGMGILIPGDVEFDFSWLGPSVHHVSSVSCWGEGALYRNHAELSKMESLRSLIALATEDVVDLSHMPSLESAFVCGNGLLSVAGSRSLVCFHVMDARLPSDFVLSPSLRELGIEVGAIDLALLHQVPELRTLVVRGAPVLDVGPVGSLQRLEVLKVFRSRKVNGFAALKRCTSLREVLIAQVSEVDDSDAILELELEIFEGIGRAFDEQFERAARGRPGWAVSVPQRRRKPATSPFLSAETTDDRYEVSFSDFGWLNEQLGIGAEKESPLLSGEVEQLMREQLHRVNPRWIDSGVLQFDSEGDAARVIAPNSATADLVVSALDELFLDKRALRRSAKRWMSR